MTIRRDTQISLARRENAVYNDGRQIREGSMAVLYEWDEEKAIENLRKHKIDFRDATAVFDDENRIEWYDTAHSVLEDRYNTIGMVDRILFVVYTERRDRIRLISARRATRKEEALYYDRNL